MIIKPNLLSALTKTDKSMQTASTRISTGYRVNTALDDPLAFVRNTATKASISDTAVKLNVIDYADTRLNSRDSVLSTMQDALTRFKELITIGSTGINQLADIAPEMKALAASMYSMANTQDSDGYMFSGASSATPFSQVAGVVTYNGSASATVLDVDGYTISGNIAGTPLTQVLNDVFSMANSVAGGTLPTAANMATVTTHLNTVTAMRTAGASELAGVTHMQDMYNSRSDLEKTKSDSLVAADMTQETLNFTEGQKQYEATMKVMGMKLNAKRLMDYF